MIGLLQLLNWKYHGVSIGQGFQFLSPCYLDNRNGGTLTIGERVSLNRNVTIDASDKGEIIIGGKVLIGQNTVIRSSNHDRGFEHIGNYVKMSNGHNPGKITIGYGTWIGANCVILPGVTIEDYCTIGAGSVVTKDMPGGCVCFGNPCKVHHDTGAYVSEENILIRRKYDCENINTLPIWKFKPEEHLILQSGEQFTNSIEPARRQMVEQV